MDRNINTSLKPVIAKTRYGDVEYAEYGEGPAVLALHGAMGGYDQSLLLARTAGGEGFRYIAVSRPGYLGTPLSSGRTPEAQANLCAALLDALNIESVLVMVVSGGGPCALNFALRYQERCRGLVLVSTCGQKVDTPIPFSFKITKLMMRLPGIAKTMEKKALENMDQMASRSIPDPDMRKKTMDDPEAGPLFRALMASTCNRMNERISGTENDINITRTTDYPLEKITVPTLIVHGTEDSMVPYEQHAAPLAARIPGAELMKIDGGEHVAIFTHRKEVKERVMSFQQAHSGMVAGLAR